MIEMVSAILTGILIGIFILVCFCLYLLGKIYRLMEKKNEY